MYFFNLSSYFIFLLYLIVIKLIVMLELSIIKQILLTKIYVRGFNN